VKDPEPVARTVAFLLSDWARAITGEIVHVDGGFHAMGARLRPAPDAGSADGPAGEGADREATTEVAQVADAVAGEDLPGER
jgi:enoyl-[acyl-carrier protein] reductase I